MTAFQMRVVGMCLTINMLDGFDILAMAFAAPDIARDWALGPATLGSLFSIGLAGMVAGSIGIALLADRLGRRPMILFSLFVATAGMVMAACAYNVTDLAIARAMTGFAVGGIGPCLNSLVAEFAPAPARTFCVALMQAGFALGSALGGLAAIGILSIWSWPGIFALGALLTALLLPLAWRQLPETQAGQRQQVCSPDGKGAASSPWWEALRSHAIPLVFGFAIFFLCLMSFYFINSWTPKILADSGLPTNLSLLGGVALAAGGIPAAFLVGALARRHDLSPIVAIATLTGAAMTFVFGQLDGPAVQVLMFALILGIFINMTQVGIYAIFPGLFPPLIRTGATGIAVGLGRLGSVAGPWVAGLMLEAHWPVPAMFVIMAVPYAVAACIVWKAHRLLKY